MLLDFLLAKLSECSVFVRVGRSDPRQPMDERYHGDDVIPFQRTVIKQIRADKGKFPSFSPHLPQSLGIFDLAKTDCCLDTSDRGRGFCGTC